MDAIEMLMSRRSYARGNLIDPAPNQAQLATILQAAMTVPDHGNIKPWRFIVVQGQGIQDLSLLVQDKYAGSMSEQHLNAFVREIASTPMMIFVCSNLVLEHHVPVLDQQMAGAAACEHILLAAHALGFAGIWHSLEADDGLHRLLNLKTEDSVLGVLSIGTPKRTSRAKRKSFTEFTQTWDRKHGLQEWTP
ncbi:nitroreductase family protein [Marinomonas mediterranea]|uniref:nitroreductase family protein n=1 Tax=Marinomonas mediterranea TaxID=119864 RepID=UPI00234A2946|nr:nitroreductase [Marinomonas mediterranea]